MLVAAGNFFLKNHEILEEKKRKKYFLSKFVQISTSIEFQMTKQTLWWNCITIYEVFEQLGPNVDLGCFIYACLVELKKTCP